MKRIFILICSLFLISHAFASEHTVNLTVAYKLVNYAGKVRKAIAVNHQIPAPTLHFRQGDTVTIQVHNQLKEETAIHWHGLLVPWQMDGVLGVTQKGIQPGSTFTYHFKLMQAGTYWYHAHAGLQEQEGLYGAIVIEPLKKPAFRYNKDYVMVLSDWSNTEGEQIHANLKKEGDYYSQAFPLQPSLAKFMHDYRKADKEEQKKLLDDYKMMQQMRMSIYDINDVAYDAFLLNGHSPSRPWTASVKIGDIVRLRFIGATGETIFRVKVQDTKVQMVHIQGNDVKPYPVTDFTVAPGETYDILVKIEKDKPYIIYAESTDTVGAAIGALVTSSTQTVNYKAIQPFPEPLPVTREMMENMMLSQDNSMKMGSSANTMQHGIVKKSAVTKSMNRHSVKMNATSMKMEPDNSNVKSKNQQSNPMNMENHKGHKTSTMENMDMSVKAPNKKGKDSGQGETISLPPTQMDMKNHRVQEPSSLKNKNMSEIPPVKKDRDAGKNGGKAMQSIQIKRKIHEGHDPSTMDNMSMPGMDLAKNDVHGTTNPQPMEMGSGNYNGADSSSMKNMNMPDTATDSKKKANKKRHPVNKMGKYNPSAPSSLHDMNMSHANMTMNSKKSMTSIDSMVAMSGKQNNMNMSAMASMKMDMPTEPSIIGDRITLPTRPNLSIEKTTGTKYQTLQAAYTTNNINKPVKGIINMELFGYMDRFIWMINGEPEYKAKPIILEPDKRYRIIFTNNSMMHHPMHIHGHWFILRNGHGSYDPLLHTIDVPPGGTVVADIDTDASGQWFFHCHMLYHMMSGMARTFQYSTLIEIVKGEAKPETVVKAGTFINRPIVRVDEVRPIDHHLVKHPSGHHKGLYFANFLTLGGDPFNNVQKLNFKGLYGDDYNKLELLTEDAEINKGKVENADIDIFYWRLISQFWAIKGGANYFYRPALKPYWQPGIGIEGLMPYFIETDIRGYYFKGSTKLDAELARSTQLTNNFFVKLGVRGILASKTVPEAQIGNGLNQMRYTVKPFYRLMPGLDAYIEYEYEKNYGAFKRLQSFDGEASSQNTLVLGLDIIF